MATRRIALALAFASAAGAAYVHWRVDVLLGIASTALALVVFWTKQPSGSAGVR